MKTLALENYGQRNTANVTTIYGYVNGVELYYKSDAKHALKLCAETFIAAMLLPAMQSGSKIEIPPDLDASVTFLRNIDTVQDIFSLWYPGLSKVEISVKGRPAATYDKTDDSALFFSGGVDACYTLLKHADSLTHLVYVKGIDMQLDAHEQWQQCLQQNLKIAEKHHKTLVPVETNVRFFIRNLSNPPIGWTMAQGCGLASIAHALGFPGIIISSSNTYNDLHPLGTHPVTDPLFSSDSVVISHDGCEARRHEKIIRINEAEGLLRNLRVCWQNSSTNCGHCDKCLHLRMALHLLQLEIEGLQPLDDYRELKAAHTGTHGECVEWADNLTLAVKVGNEEAIKALRKILNRYKRKQLLKLVDEIYFNSRFQNLKGRVIKNESLTEK